MAWRIEFDGQVYREADLTIGQAEDIEAASGLTWRQINPLRSASCARSILEVMHADRTGITRDAAKAQVRALKVDDFNVEPDEDDLPEEFTDGFPPAADGPSTTS